MRFALEKEEDKKNGMWRRNLHQNLNTTDRMVANGSTKYLKNLLIDRETTPFLKKHGY
jgi:hypothetical protein